MDLLAHVCAGLPGLRLSLPWKTANGCERMFRSALALPFKGRGGWGWGWVCRLALSREPAHVPVFFRPPSWRPSHFLLLVQEKVTKENTPSRPRSRGHPCPRDSASRLRGPLTAHPCAEIGRTRILRVPACRARGYFLRLLAAAEREPGKSRARQSLLQKHRIYATSDISDTSVSFFFPSFALLFGSPLSSGGGRTDQPRAPHAGGARDRADSDNGPWMARGPNPSTRSEPLAPRAARIRGCLFLWLLSFGQAKESNWRPWMADKPHTDVSRSSRQHNNPEPTPSPPNPPLEGEG